MSDEISERDLLIFLSEFDLYIKDKNDLFPAKLYPYPNQQKNVLNLKLAIQHLYNIHKNNSRGFSDMFPNSTLISILNNDVINYSSFDPQHVEPSLDYLLNKSREAIDVTIEKYKTMEALNASQTIEHVLFPMEEADDRVSRLWAYFSHINAVNNNDVVTAAFEVCSKKLTEYGLEVGQNKNLYRLYEMIKQSTLWDDASEAQRKSIENAIRGFKFSGIDLEGDEQHLFNQTSKRISELKIKISQNVLSCEDSFIYHTEDIEDLEGLPSQYIRNAQLEAEKRNENGYVLLLTRPIATAVLTFCKNRQLRELFYRANVTVASNMGDFDVEWDNAPLIKELLDLKKTKARLLGFSSIAELSVETKMAESPQHVIDFLNDIAAKTRPSAEADIEDVKQFAEALDGLVDLQPWDVSYYSEKLREERFSFSEEQVREYFPLDAVLPGMLQLVERLYGITFVKNDTIDAWDPTVLCYDVGRDGNRIASFYMDLFTRKGKRSGAWMAECTNRWRRIDGTVQLPTTFLTCNFNKSMDDGVPSLLSHDDVVTLFHEFGHGLHHMLTQVDVSGVSGISGVQWDAVELPSQFMENWCWQPEVVASLSRHYQTSAPLPNALLDSMIKAKNFQSGLFITRQVSMGLFDMTLHHTYTPETIIHDVIDAVNSRIAVIQPPDYNRYECSFLHIFGGGYSAGYYSYLWAEVLSADAFSKFEEEGLFNDTVCRDFETKILARGGSRDAMDLFVDFRGRKPSLDAFLKHSGIGTN